MSSENLLKQLKKAKEEGKIEDKKSKFIRKKSKGEKLNELLKKAAYGDEPKVDNFGLRKEESKGGRVTAKNGGKIAKGCGAVLPNRRKKTKYY
jgi:hypothetical protein|tara:strand:+ start:115 stop:393 length:279 start_codon:yes stop_codon:yes gene_type:complete